MAEKKFKPKIRFKGYMDDWEQCKLGEIATIRTGYPFDSNDFDDNGEYLVITNGNIQNDSPTVDSSLGNRINFNNDALSEYVLNLNDILVTMDGMVGRTAKVVDQKQILAQRVGRLTAKSDSEFLYQFLNTGEFFKKMALLSHGGTIKHISLNEISSYISCMPSSSVEQTKIGAFFKNIDNLITFHQCKYDKLIKVKKSMLEKMFPKDGGRVPEIRFKDFIDDWEQRKLGEIGTIQTCKRIFKEQTSESGDIPFYKNGTLGLKADAYISRKVFEEYKELYPYPRVGDVLISVVGSIGRTAEYKGNDEYFQDSNIVWLKTNNNIIDKIFLKISYQIIDWIIEGSTIKHLYNDNILASKVWIPSSIDEQKAIGGLFDSLDNIITLNKRKLEKLKNIKKSMLEKMFL